MAPSEALRVVLVTSRFWPLADERALRSLALARRLTSAGCAVTVLTPQWDRRWAAQMPLDEVQVVRLPGAPRGGWSSLRWYFHLARRLRQQRPKAVCVAGMKQEAAVTLAAARRGGWPTVLLAEEDDPAWGQATPLGRRVAATCRAAAAVVVPQVALAETLTQQGLTQVQVVPWAAETPPRQDACQREAARRALAGVNPDLVATPSMPVVLTVARLEPAQQLDRLVRAWQGVADQRPDARLWIVGDGPLREALYRQVRDLDLRFRVLLPGTFDSLRELLYAADALLVPAMRPCPPLALVEGVAAGLPLLLPEGPLAASWATVHPAVVRFPPDDAVATARAILDWLGRWQPPPGNRTGLAGSGCQETGAAAPFQRNGVASCPLDPGEEGQRLAGLLRRLIERSG